MRLATTTGNRARERAPENRRRGNAADPRGLGGAIRLTPAAPGRKHRRHAAFTLAEVLAAMLFMAIVIPVVVEALHVASVSGEVAVRKTAAARIAERVLNENIVSTNWNQYLTGTITENGLEFRWTLRNEYWAADSVMQLVTAEVEFSAQGRGYAVRTSTLANSQSSSTTTTTLK